MIVAALVCPPLACQSRRSDDGLRTVRMRIGDATLTLEVADTEALRAYGLMHRDSLPADRGMIFVFPREEPLGFWMKNTRIPLDIAFLDASGKVVSIHQMYPYDLRLTRSAGPAMYAIEVNQGRLAKAGLEVGDILQLPPELRPSEK